MIVDYNALKSNIIKSCKADKGEIYFLVNYDKLLELSNNIGLTLVNIGTKSNRIKPTDVVFLSEYFKESKLSWLNEVKEFTTLVFVQNDSIDENCKNLLNDMNNFDNEIDKVKTLSEIVAKYPCCFATIISYLSNDPNRFEKTSYEIKCRANTVAIKKENYKYNNTDM